MEHPENTVYLIRHAQSEANLSAGYINGRSNESPITELGERQARSLGRWASIHALFPDAVYVSPALRTLETMKHVLGAMNIDPPVTIDDRLQELDQGSWAGKLKNDVYTEEVNQRIIRLNKNFAAPGGESMNETGSRMHAALGDMKNNGTSFVFTHGLAIRCLAGQLHGWPQSRIRQDNTRNTSMTRLSRVNGRWQVDKLPNGRLWLGHVPHFID